MKSNLAEAAIHRVTELLRPSCTYLGVSLVQGVDSLPEGVMRTATVIPILAGVKGESLVNSGSPLTGVRVEKVEIKIYLVLLTLKSSGPRSALGILHEVEKALEGQEFNGAPIFVNSLDFTRINKGILEHRISLDISSLHSPENTEFPPPIPIESW